MALDVVTVTIVILGLLLSSSLHEAMHALVSFKLGDNTAQREGRLSFNPIRHIDLFLSVLLPLGLILSGLPPFGAAKPVPYNPSHIRGGEKGIALVGISGPLTNLLLALCIGLPLRFIVIDESLHNFIELLVVINLGFFVFNLLPIPPLDGSRVLYAFAPESLKIFMRGIEAQGLLVVFLCVLLFSSILGTVTGYLVAVIFELITGYSAIY